MTLFETTMALLNARPRTLTLSTIAQDSGVGHEWLSKLSQGKMADPSVHKVQRVHDYLARRK